MNVESELIESEPGAILRRIIALCQTAYNVRVASGDHNVELTDRWVRSRHNKPVSVVGAYLLVMQPAPDDDDKMAAPDPTGCAAHAMGCASLWLEGVNDGAAGEPDANRLAQFPRDDPRGQQYRDGLLTGAELSV